MTKQYLKLSKTFFFSSILLQSIPISLMSQMHQAHQYVLGSTLYHDHGAGFAAKKLQFKLLPVLSVITIKIQEKQIRSIASTDVQKPGL